MVFCYGSPSKLIESLCLWMALGIWGILHLAEPTCHHQSQKMAAILFLSPPHTEEEGLWPRLGQWETSTPDLASSHRQKRNLKILSCLAPFLYSWRNGGTARVICVLIRPHGDSMPEPRLSALLPVCPKSPGTKSSSSAIGHPAPEHSQGPVSKDERGHWCLPLRQRINVTNPDK